MRCRTAVLVMGVVAMAGCGTPAAPPSNTPARTADTPAPTADTPAPTADTPAPTADTTDRRTVVVLDPGHNGGNARATGAINRKVDAGRGRTKPCNTSGTSSVNGYPEHAFTFDVAQRIRALLAAEGVTVILTRTTDTGIGPCVDRRAAIGNETKADVMVSIHADGHAKPTGHGFHIAYSDPPLNSAQAEPAMRLARAVRAAMRAAGFADSNYLGSQALSPRNDLAGLNLARRPAVLVECGNMRNPAEAARMATQSGRQRYAEAIARGILGYLER